MKSKYVNLFTDFGFKKLFGEEASKSILIDFLNSMLPADSHIRDLAFKNTERLGWANADRRAVYDIYCENDRGEKFIVELQKAKHNFFKERTIYYSTFPIKEMAEKGEWDYNLQSVFCIGVLDFVFNDYATEPERKEVMHEIKLRNKKGEVFYDKLTYIYLEMPNFNKREEELVTRLDKWLYFIKYIEDFQTIPEIFKNEVVFIEAFEKARLASFDEDEQAKYEYSLKIYRDWKGVMETAKMEAEAQGMAKGIEKGIEKGIAEGMEKGIEKGEAIGLAKGLAAGKAEEKMAIAKELKANGVPVSVISVSTGLSSADIEQL